MFCFAAIVGALAYVSAAAAQHDVASVLAGSVTGQVATVSTFTLRILVNDTHALFTMNISKP
jgi:hypothetical protein